MDYCSNYNNEDHLKHKIKKVHMFKKFFFKNFIIGLILMIIICLIVWMMKNGLWTKAEAMYDITAYDCKRIFLTLMGIWKLFLVQFALVPFISLAMIEGHLKKHLNKD